MKREEIQRGEYLIWRPSGLKVFVLDIYEEGAHVLAPRGGRFTITFDHLEPVQ